MQDERKRILDLVEKGTITAQDAIVLLEKLEQPSKQTEENTRSTHSSEETSFEQSQSNTQQNNHQEQSYSQQSNDEYGSWQQRTNIPKESIF